MACVGLFSQCQDDGEYDHPINRNNFPEVPILFNGTTFGANPYIVVSYQRGTPQQATAPFSITLTIPDDVQANFKEITKVFAGATGITPGGLSTTVYTTPVPAGKTLAYFTAPIAASGKSVTINTSLAEFQARLNTAALGVITNAQIDALNATTTYVERAFLFQVTLDDNTTVVTQQFRIRVTK